MQRFDVQNDAFEAHSGDVWVEVLFKSTFLDLRKEVPAYPIPDTASSPCPLTLVRLCDPLRHQIGCLLLGIIVGYVDAATVDNEPEQRQGQLL